MNRRIGTALNAVTHDSLQTLEGLAVPQTSLLPWGPKPPQTPRPEGKAWTTIVRKRAWPERRGTWSPKGEEHDVESHRYARQVL